jgi:hypothetical protein
MHHAHVMVLVAQGASEAIGSSRQQTVKLWVLNDAASEFSTLTRTSIPSGCDARLKCSDICMYMHACAGRHH